MIINPRKAVDQGWLKGLLSEEDQIQQNGIDLTLRSIARLDGGNLLTLSNREHCPRTPLESTNPIYLSPGVYELLYNEEFDIPNGVCVMLHTRSTIIRGGNFITSGLFDAGFKGLGGGILHVKIPLEIELNVRVAQAVFMQAEEGQLYDGVYNKETSLQNNS